MRKRLRCIEEYIAGLGNPNWDVSARCEDRLIRALKRLRKSRPRAVDLLIAATAHPDAQVRLRAVWALASTRWQRVCPTILALTTDPVPTVAYDAAMALGRFRFVQAIEPLIALVRRTPLEGAVDSAAACSLRRLGRPAVPSLLGLLHSETTAVRSLAISTLGGIADPTVIAPLSALLGDRDEKIRIDAVEALGRIGEEARPAEAERCLEHLSGCLNDPSDDVRRHTHWWIGAIRTKAGAAIK